MADADHNRFKHLTFNDFRIMAQNDRLSRYEKIGFPDAYREGKEENIFEDICRKLINLGKEEQVVMDIGPGCSGLAFMLIEACRAQRHKLILVDSQEMLNHLPNESFIVKINGRFPDDCADLLKEYAGKINVILTYSVLHYVFAEGRVFDFLDRALSLLADGGELLIGDIPNISKRRRFFASPAGIKFHKQFAGTDQPPEVMFNKLEHGQIDDAVVAAIVLRARQSSFDAYWMPQAADLPMANRREDILIKKP